MSQTAVLIVPGSIATLTGGYEYDRRIVDGLRTLGWSVDVRELDASFPWPTPDALRHTDRVLAEIPDGTIVLIDGLAFGAMPQQAKRESARLTIVPVIHSLLAADVGLDRSAATVLEASERRALAAASLVVVAGTALIDPLARYGIARDRIRVVEPGTDPAPLARGSGQPDMCHMVCVATLNPGKGHDVLFRALAMLPMRNWRLTCAGSATRHPETAERLRSIVESTGLADRVVLAGELNASAVADLYDRADLFVLPTLTETHPLSVVEALARGLPVVSTTAGAIPELVRDGAGLLVAPGDANALAEALAMVLRDPTLRERLATGARDVRQRLPTWHVAAVNMAVALERVG
jgi:glycosyltransferase involved in cell wall biosynthesis